MSYVVKILPAAKVDIQEIFQYYNKQKKGLAKLFFLHLKNSISIASNSPLIFQIQYKNTRHLTIKKFPFQVHFIVKESEQSIVIIAVTHTSRNPQIWKKRSQ